MRPISSVVALTLIPLVYAAIGPQTDLYVVNKFVTPDGFNRSWVRYHHHYGMFCWLGHRAILAGSTPATASAPGPLIVGNIVCVYFIESSCHNNVFAQGDVFRLNVIDSLTNTSMVTTTSIVSWSSVTLLSSFDNDLIALAWYLPERNELGWRSRRSYSMSYHSWRRVSLSIFGSRPIRYILVPFSSQFVCAGFTWIFVTNNSSETQYCDGLRGPLVIYDPNDPLNGL